MPPAAGNNQRASPCLCFSKDARRLGQKKGEDTKISSVMKSGVPALCPCNKGYREHDPCAGFFCEYKFHGEMLSELTRSLCYNSISFWYKVKNSIFRRAEKLKETVRVGIIGFEAGTSAASILIRNREILRERAGVDIVLKRIADKDVTRDRGLELPDGLLTTDANEILNDPEIDIVVELIGGINPAKDFILKALRNGKHVVTANKALLATEGNDIFEEAGRLGAEVGFEASVAGGIPIIKVLREGLVANRVLNIYGIINGTSKYIITKMTEEGTELPVALKEAQKLGYAKADPTFDIEGIETAHKLTILASLAYNIRSL